MEETTIISKSLTKEELECLEIQNKRLVSDFKANLLETNDRHWTTREFTDLINESHSSSSERRVIFEIGCGVGNFIFPLVKEKLNLFIYACDFSPRAVEFVKMNNLYNEECIKAFVADVTTDDIFDIVKDESVDITTLVFVLSAIHPEKFNTSLRTIWRVLKPGGVVLFRDYGIYDMAQLRFKPGNKISENFYMRQDGTRSYYFSLDFLRELFITAGYEVVDISYIHRRTINKKENIDVPRIFIQGKFKKNTVS